MRRTIKSTEKMSNTQWHVQNKPSWWVRAGRGKKAIFIDIGSGHRGDKLLEVEIEVNGNIRFFLIGAGSKEKGIREVVRLK